MIEILHRYIQAVLYRSESATTVKDATAEAVAARADLTRANLAGAKLTGAYLTDATGVIDAGTPNGWRAVGWMWEGGLRVRVGCQNKALAEGRDYWAGKDDRREVLAALDYIEAVARLRGWGARELHR